MPLSNKLDRKLRAAEESSDGEDYYEVTDRSSSESLIETGAGGEVISSGDEGGEGQGSQDEEMVSFQRALHCTVQHH
jgi:ribosomal RNA-processing protein 36